MRRRWRGFSVAVLAALALPATAVEAAPHPSLATVATGTPSSSTIKLFNDACGTVVDTEGHVYVSDYQNRLIGVFAGGGKYLTNAAATEGENGPCGVGVDSVGNVYAADYHGGVFKYLPSVWPFPFEGWPTYPAPAAFASGRATGLAVDPGADAVYVTRRTHVSIYDAEGTELLQVGLGSLGDAYGAAVSGFAPTAGRLYVADAATGTVEVFDPGTDPLEPVATIDGAATPQGEFRDLTDAALAVDDSNGHLFVLDNLQPGFEHPLAAVYEFDAAGNYLGQLPKAIVHGGPSGLAVDNSFDPESGKRRGTVYATSGNEVIFFPGSPPSEQGSLLYSFCPAEPSETQINNGLCPAVPAPSHVLAVTRAGDGLGTVAGGQTPIECGTVCAWEFDQGAQVTLFADPKPRSAFSGWSVAGQPGACPGIGSCKVTIGADTEVTATFAAIPQRTLTVSRSGAGTVTSSPVGLTCGAVCAASFDQGAQVTLTPEPGPGHEFAGWSGACSGPGACKVDLAGDASVAARFKPVERVAPLPPGQLLRTLAISVTGPGAGTISSEPAGIDCGTPCSGSYPPGVTVTLVAKPDPGSRFAGWSGCDGVAAGRCVVTLVASRTVGAVFVEAKPKRCKPKATAKHKKSRAKCKGAKPKRGGKR